MDSRVVLVTGASSGIGAATASRLVSAGYVVYGAARRIDRIAALPGVIPVEMDITDEGQVSTAVTRIISEQGRLDVLVNNAGFAQYGPVEEVSIDAARYQFEVNLFGLARLTQLVIPHMRAQKSGTIVNISSMGGRIYTPLGAWYHATKHALEGWSDCLRVELKPLGIDVVIIEPGGIATEFSDVLAQHTSHLPSSAANSPYQDLTDKVTRTLSDPDFVRRASPPSLIADTILTAISSSKPKSRYMAGYLAKPMWRLRRFGGDGLYDRAVARIVKEPAASIVDKGGAGRALPGGAEGGAEVRVREGISVCTEPTGRALAVSPRYQPNGTRPPNRGALSHFAPVQ